MMQLPVLMKVTSAALAAAITASITYGQYAVASGPKGSGLMPPATMFVPDADADAAVDPLAEVMRAFAALKLEKAKTARTRAMIDWLVGLQAHDLAGFTARQADGGVIYDIGFERADAGAPRRIYLAVPYGADMPYAVRVSETAAGAMRIEGISCLRRETLSDLSGTSDPALAEAVALDWADAYLGAPDTADPKLAADCLVTAISAD